MASAANRSKKAVLLLLIYCCPHCFLGLAVCIRLQLHAGGSGLGLYGSWGLGFTLCLLLGLPVGFILLQYSVLFTVESLSLLYLLVIS